MTATRRYGHASDAQVLFHQVRNTIAETWGHDFQLIVTPPEHARIGDPADGWGVHVVPLGEPYAMTGLGKTLEGALCDLYHTALFHRMELDGLRASNLESRGDTAWQQCDDRFIRDLRLLGLHDLAEEFES